MGDWGIRISKDSVSVDSGDDKDMVLTSKYPNLKGSIAGTGSVSCPQSGVWTTVTINHGLGYIPMVQAFAKDRDSDYFSPYYWPMGFVDYVFGTEIIWRATADSNNIYLEFWYDDFGFGGPNVDIVYFYTIFIDKGKI